MKNKVIYTPIEEETREIVLARRILAGVCSGIKTKVHEFIPVLNQITFVPVEEDVEIGTNGEVIFFHAENILQYAKIRNFRKLELTILHILLHGILGHFEKVYWKQKKLAWIVEDIQVFRFLHLFFGFEKYWDEEIDALLEDFIGDELYFKGSKDKKLRKFIKKNRKIFWYEDHRLWDPVCQNSTNKNEELKEEVTQAEENKTKENKKQIWQNARELLVESSGVKHSGSATALQMILNGRAGGKQPGQVGAEEENEVEFVNKNTNSYKALLEKITSLCERNQEEEEIDRVLYQYGLEMYGDVPLVEPEEINEKYCLHTVVVAVDTSGSCTDLACIFFREIVALFEEIKKIGKIEHLCYLECDYNITKQKDYYDLEEFVEFGKKHTFSGGGGTDFTPVFKHADHLMEQGEQVNALIYITDGWGEFPKYPEGPAYDTYLLLDATCEDDILHVKNNYVPAWAECLSIEA